MFHSCVRVFSDGCLIWDIINYNVQWVYSWRPATHREIENRNREFYFEKIFCCLQIDLNGEFNQLCSFKI